MPKGSGVGASSRKSRSWPPRIRITMGRTIIGASLDGDSILPAILLQLMELRLSMMLLAKKALVILK
ncbi:hypothetical protein D3C77_593530 [compost metagenome]